MPQIQVFQCPSCGANLSYDGGPETSFPCQFCGTTVVVPQELRPAAPAAPPLRPVAGSPGGDLSGLPLDKLARLKHLVRNGQKAEAIRLYREILDVSSTEAQAAIEQIEAGRPLVVTSTSMETPGIGADTDASRVAEAIRLGQSGQMQEALRLLRESQGTGAQETKEVLEELTADQPPNLSGVSASPSQPDAGRAAVEQLARTGQTIEAIKLYRSLYGVGLKEAKYAVEAIAGGRPATAAGRVGKALGCGGAGCGLLFTIGIIGFVLAMMYLPMRMSGSYQQALDAARSDPAVVAALGAPVEASWWPSTGEISCGSTCSANYVIPIHGSRKSGRIIVQSDSTGAGFFNEGTWILDATVVVDNGPTVDLTPPPPPAPTLSPADADATQGALTQATQEAQASADADATATAVDMEQGTATAQASADDAATAVAEAQTGVQTMEAAQGAWPLTTKVNPTDPFHGWPTGLRQDSYIAVTSTVKSTKYLWTVVSKQDGSYINLTPNGGTTVTDFYAQVDLQFLQGASGNTYAYGLVFRRQGSDYGFFGLENDGRFRALEVRGSGIYQELEDPSSAILTKPGAVNHLLVRSMGNNYIFVVNGTVVGQMSADFSDGEVGLGVDAANKGSSAQAQFANFEVHAPPP